MFRPGGQLHPQYFLEHKWNFIFEGILLVVIAYMFLQRSGPKKKQDRPLSEKVGILGRCRGWQDAQACILDACPIANLFSSMPWALQCIVSPC